MGQFTTFPISNRTLTNYTKLVYLTDFGAVGNNIADDTAAINTCYASVQGTGATVVWPPGTFKVTDTIVIGAAVGGAGAVTSFISTYCPGGPNNTVLSYSGPTDGRPALHIGRNKYFTVTGLNVSNATGNTTTTVGLRMGGAGAGDFGNQVLAGTFQTCSFVGFHTGTTDGNFGAASEILWNNCSWLGNSTGWVMNDFNSLDHIWVMFNSSGNGVGIDSGAQENINVFGGSSSNNSIADFQLQQNCAIANIQAYRSEGANRVIKTVSTPQNLTMIGCRLNAPSNGDKIMIESSNVIVHIESTTVQGRISLTNSRHITITDCLLFPDQTTKLPATIVTGGGNFSGGPHVTFKNNMQDTGNDASTQVAVLDYDGQLSTTSNFANTGVIGFDPCQFIHRSWINSNSGAALDQYGIDWQALCHVRHLSEGSQPAVLTGYDFHGASGSAGFGQNLRVQGTFATSATLAFTFTRTVTIAAQGQQPNITLSAGTFLQSDVGKALLIPGVVGGADWHGFIMHVVDTTHAYIQPMFPQQTPSFGAPVVSTIGTNEPDGQYMVAGLVGNVNETFWVTAIANTGFTLHSSNAASTATVTALIVR
jgi:hypothetical protein